LLMIPLKSLVLRLKRDFIQFNTLTFAYPNYT
jgi:hypothetical protein